MAVYDHAEQEQIDELRVWWQQYGNLITGALLLLAIAMAAWQGWNWWQRDQAAKASVLFTAVERALASQDAKLARDVTGELIDKYARTEYASMAGLLSARLQMTSGDLKTAKVQLNWVVDHAPAPELRDLARLRFAELLLAEKSYAEVVKLLAVQPASAFLPRYAELKGDAYAAEGKLKEARAAYQDALDTLDAEKTAEAQQVSVAYRELLQVKQSSLPTEGEAS